jgi:hypothetical protein
LVALYGVSVQEPYEVNVNFDYSNEYKYNSMIGAQLLKQTPGSPLLNHGDLVIFGALTVILSLGFGGVNYYFIKSAGFARGELAVDPRNVL